MINYPIPCYMALFIIELNEDLEGFEEMNIKMYKHIEQQVGYIGGEEWEIKDGRFVSIYYWDSLESIHMWRDHSEHKLAIEMGKKKWFKNYQIIVSEIKYTLKKAIEPI